MNKIYLYNTLHRKKEEFKPIKTGKVGLYTCGPTVYNFAHIGNLRTYIFEDILKRVLLYNGYQAKHVMNITDVGHLTGDMDMGEDKLEKGAKRENKSAREIADFYTFAFKEDIKRLNIIEPDVWLKATETIAEQIGMIKVLEKRGYTYKVSDGLYFDTSKFKDYTKLSHLNLETLREGARVERNDEKRNPTDFALWKFSQKPGARQQEWDSPWGVGFPGWHLECSVMSSMGLGEQLDIHCGGVDHINVHHTNEIAQYEAAYGKQFFNYWMHGAFLNIAGGKKMAKSENNFLTLENVFVKKGIDPLAFRFAALQTHYRKPMEYSGEIIKNAEKGLKHLLNQTMDLQIAYSGTVSIDKKFNDKFTKAINDDLNMPQALSITQELLKSDLSDDKKYYTVLWFDRILGVITEWINIKQKESENLPKNIKEKKEERAVARKRKNWEESDRLRDELEKSGYIVEDIKNNKQRIYKK